MSRNEFTTFAVAGVGGLGQYIAAELVAQGATVFALTRGGGNTKIPAGVTERVVDYADSQSVQDALGGVDVLVSALSGSGLRVQPALADAAKKAGVKLFVPSEYGVRTPEITWGFMLAKPKLQQRLKEIGLPYTLFFNGSFSDLGPRFGLDLPNKKATLVGSGTAPVSWTTRPDIGHFIAYILTHLPPSTLDGGIFGVEGSRHTLLEMLALVETTKLSGGKLDITHRDESEVKRAVEEKDIRALDLATIGDYLSILTDEGLCCVGEYDATHLVPDFKPLNLAQAIEKYW
ncbi:NAD(P)-binding protein [Exidia glandulosa HHB12029]|uniref:NAD(P)-binding protein n=1 Tax=Exidia glandulosa HHB12029 TaxID=1314781 RepID=A0A165P1G0_EXIGL|nr:NAD(P)-binding protein [Exidia glandulosa HHB12029]